MQEEIGITSVENIKNEAIVATGLTKWFGQGETKVTAVNCVTLVAHFGEMLFIVGPSGSGKTTMLSMISGILRPNAGKVLVKGADIWTLTSDQLADFRLNTIGFVFQDYHLFPRLTTAENVAIPLILKERDWGESIIEAKKYLEIVGLKGRGDILPVKLSGGEQQRVAIARAIISGPEILILDEPTASLVLPQSELEGKIIGLKHGACLMKDEPMPVDRRHFTGAQKLAILREHLLDKTPISDVCQKHDIQPTLFYLWQKKLFEDGAAVFDSKAANARQQNADAQKVQALQAKLQQKNEVLAELMGEHVELKKSLGLI